MTLAMKQLEKIAAYEDSSHEPRRSLNVWGGAVNFLPERKKRLKKQSENLLLFFQGKLS